MSIAARILTIHSMLALVLIIGVFVALTTAGFFVTRKFMPEKFEPSHNNIVGYIFGTLGTIYAVLLGFAILVIWQDYGNTQQYVALEAAESVTFYQDLSLYPDPEAAYPVKAALAAYISSLIKDEFPAMARMQSSVATDEAFQNLWNKLGTLDPRNMREQTLYGQILTDMNSLARSRTSRLQAAVDELPEMIWLALIFGAVVTVGCTLSFSADHVMAHLFMASLLTTLLAIVCFVMVGLDHPFIGWGAIQPAHFERALEVIRQGL